MPRRLASIRRGIQYQDLVAAEALLEMFINRESPPVWVSLENRQGGTFDDVVVGYPNHVVWKQVKWAQNPGADPLTIDSLAATDSRRRKPLIQAFAESYEGITAGGVDFQLELVTNRSPDGEFQRFLNGRTSRIKTSLTKQQKERLDSAWRSCTTMNKTQFRDFLRTVSFLVNSPDIDRLECSVNRDLNALHCQNDAFERLLRAISEWSTDDAQEKIGREDVERVLTPSTETPPNEFLLPETRVDRPEVHEELARRVEQLTRGYVVLLGSPGSGKSTLLNTLSNESRLSQENHVVVYNCFTATSDSFLRTRAKANNFARYLARKLYELYKDYDYIFEPGSVGIETLMARASGCTREKKLVVIIDGFDYAQRFASENEPSLFDSLPPELPEKIVVVVSAQVAEQLPEHLRRLAVSQAFLVPPLDRLQIAELLTIYDISNRASLKAYEYDDLCTSILNLTDGHALHVGYIARQLDKAVERGEMPTDVIHNMPSTGGDITDYYNRIFSPPDRSLARDALSIMAGCPFELTASEIAELLGPLVSKQSIEDVLRDSVFLFHQINEAYHFFHDSLRVFAVANLPKSGFLPQKQIEFLSSLNNDPRTGEHLLHFSAECDVSVPILEQVDCNWLASQIAAGASTALLKEGLEKLAVAELERGHWGKMARWWSLKSCLERAEMEGELYESTMLDAWLAMGKRPLAERYSLLASQFLSTVYPGPDLIDLLEQHGYEDLATRVSDQRLTQRCPTIAGFGFNPEFEHYIRHLAKRVDPGDIVALVRQKAKEAQAAEAHIELRVDPEDMVRRYAEVAAYECLYSGDLDRVASWLSLESLPFTDDTATDLWLRLRIARNDLSKWRSKVHNALGVAADIELLFDTYQTGEFDDEVSGVLQDLPLLPLLNSELRWLEVGHRLPQYIRHLYCDVFLCCKLSIDDRLHEIKSCAHVLSNQVGHVFTSGLIHLTERLAKPLPDWRGGLGCVVASIDTLMPTKYNIQEIEAAQEFVRSLETYLRPAAEAARAAGEMREFGTLAVDHLLPALQARRIGYESGILSICGLLQDSVDGIDIVVRQLDKLEKRFNDDVEFKSGALIDLSSRYSRVGDINAAERTLVAGIRAAFTYGYRKDTTINEFIMAFECVEIHLGERRKKVACFIASVLLLLDKLTDGRMLYDTPAHLVAVVCKFEVDLAVHLASVFQRSCRQLKSPLGPALMAHGVDLAEVHGKFAERSFDISSGEATEEDDAGEFFVVSDDSFPMALEQLRRKTLESIESSAYGSGLYKLPNVIRSLLAQGNDSDAVEVFAEFENAVRQLVSVYPMDTSFCSLHE